MRKRPHCARMGPATNEEGTQSMVARFQRQQRHFLAFWKDGSNLAACAVALRVCMFAIDLVMMLTLATLSPFCAVVFRWRRLRMTTRFVFTAVSTPRASCCLRRCGPILSASSTTTTQGDGSPPSVHSFLRAMRHSPSVGTHAITSRVMR